MARGQRCARLVTVSAMHADIGDYARDERESKERSHPLPPNLGREGRVPPYTRLVWKQVPIRRAARDLTQNKYRMDRDDLNESVSDEADPRVKSA